MNVEVVKIPIENVKKGMILGSDVTSCSRLIARKGDIINKNILNNLKYSGFTYAPILWDSDNTSEDSWYGNDISGVYNSNEFQKFNKDFVSQVDNLQGQLNGVLKGNEKIDVDALLYETQKILSDAGSSYKLFDMLYCMKGYDDQTYVHSLNVSLIATVLAEWSNLSQEEINNVTLAGMLHDIGKTQIPLEIITKHGKLTKEEFDIVKKHPLDGYNLIKDKNINEKVKLAVLQHHEKCDGTGYPYGLKSEEIDDIAKIITIADIYDAMTSARCYRGPICPFKVIQTFESEGMNKYEARFLFPFFRGIVQTYMNKSVALSNGDIGKIIMINQHDISRPLVSTGDKFIDLSKNRNVEIQNII